jgi:AraC-like DNA-binding protein
MSVHTIIIAGIALAAFLLSLVLSKKNKLPADKYLIAYLLFFIVSQVYFYFEALGTFQYSSLMLLGRGVYLLGGPIFFYYVYTLTTSKTISRKLYALTLLPFTAYVLHFLYYYWIGFGDHHIQLETGLLYMDGELSVTWTFFVVLLMLSDPFYLVWFYMLLGRYRKQTSNSVSNFDKINLNWLKVVFYIWAVSVFIFLPILALSIGQKWFSSGWISWLVQIDYLVFIFLLGFFGFRQSAVFSVPPVEIDLQNERKPASYERSGLNPEQASIYHRKLLALMKEEQPYLDGELTAQQLAARLDISPNHLSQVINQLEGKNFFDFINHYRIEEVKRKMADSKYQHLTLLALALDSGFNSKTSFNTVFKKLTGLTPSQYQKSMSGK